MELRASLELKGMHRDAIQVGIFRFLSSVDRQKICSHKDTAHRVQVVQVVLWRLAETLKMNNIVGSKADQSRAISDVTTQKQ